MNQNLVKKYSSLTQTKFRRQYGLFLAEGPHLVEELLESKWEIECVIVSADSPAPNLPSHRKTVAIESVGKKILEKISDTRTPQDILAVVRIPKFGIHDLEKDDRIIVTDKIKDPGNMGTIIRSAAAFGFTAIVTTTGSADIFSPKVIRSTQGAIFAMTTVQDQNPGAIIERFGSSHGIYVLSGDGDYLLESVEIKRKSVLVVGGEISGVSAELLNSADYKVRIPISRDIESLNAAVAAAIAMYRISL